MAHKKLSSDILSNVKDIIAAIKTYCDVDFENRDYSIRIWISELDEKEEGISKLANIIGYINRPGMINIYGNKFEICYDYGAPWDAETATEPERVGIKLSLI